MTKFNLSKKFYGKTLKTLLRQSDEKPNAVKIDAQIIEVATIYVFKMYLYKKTNFNQIKILDSKRNEFRPCS